MPKIVYVTPDDRLQKVFDQSQSGDTIFLSPGIYRQKAVLSTPGVTLTGSGRDATVIVFDDYARKPDEKGFPLITFRTYTLAVVADSVTVRDLSVVNDALSPETKGQEVALSVVADNFLMENCRLRSTQDTLFAGPLPEDLIERYTGFLRDDLRRGGDLKQIFRNCLIEGTVDFIFGCGSTRFEGCELRSLLDARNIGYVAAPAHGKEQRSGYVFRNCRFTCEAGVTPQSIYLARPWRDHGMCHLESCSYGPHIAPEGFDKWQGTQRDLTARFSETPQITGRVAWANRK